LCDALAFRLSERMRWLDEKVLEEIKAQGSHAKDDSPLHLIREKEIEISGRVLASKKQAENLVAESRKKAAETVTRAELEADELAAKHEKKKLTEAQKEAERLRAGVGEELTSIEEAIAGRRTKAVDAVVEMVTRVQ
jgi:vacuolar-type H+-ATPase subunit H